MDNSGCRPKLEEGGRRGSGRQGGGGVLSVLAMSLRERERERDRNGVGGRVQGKVH